MKITRYKLNKKGLLSAVDQFTIDQSPKPFYEFLSLSLTMALPNPKINTSTQVRFTQHLVIINPFLRSIPFNHNPTRLLQDNPSSTNIPLPTSTLPIRINIATCNRT